MTLLTTSLSTAIIRRLRTWDASVVPEDAEVGVGGDDARLEDLLPDDVGERVRHRLRVRLVGRKERNKEDYVKLASALSNQEKERLLGSSPRHEGMILHELNSETISHLSV